MAGLRFKKLYVEITSVCNLRCSFCPPTSRLPATMSVEDFRRVAAQIAGFTRHVHFHVKGEPLLHPHLGELLDAAHEQDLKVHLVTNGTRIADRAELLLSHPAVHKVDFSLHSWEGGTDQALEAYLDPILEFTLRARDADRLITVLRLWNRPHPGIAARVEAAFPRSGNRLGAKSFLDFERQFAWPSLEGTESAEGFCLGLRDQAAILVDGTVVPCCLDGEGVIALGNVFDQDFAAIVASPRAQALYRGFTERRCVEPLCRRCQFKHRFGHRLSAPTGDLG